MITTPEAEQDFNALFDMKLFNDRQFVPEILLGMYRMQNLPPSSEENGREKITQGIFNKEDSDLLETAMDDKRAGFILTDEMLKKADETPSEVFKDFVKNARFPKITSEEMSQLNQVDKEALPKMMQMVTESGPDIGAGPVSVIYNDEI